MTTEAQDQIWRAKLDTLEARLELTENNRLARGLGYADYRDFCTHRYLADIESQRRSKAELAELVDRREHPENYPDPEPVVVADTGSTFDGRTLRQFDRHGKLTGEILCAVPGQQGRVTHVGGRRV